MIKFNNELYEFLESTSDNNQLIAAAPYHFQTGSDKDLNHHYEKVEGFLVRNFLYNSTVYKQVRIAKLIKG